MALTPGMRLGVYEVTAQIGEGGMGKVYRAHDTKLNRKVAIKVLPDLFAADPERIARFEREAKTLASLNNSHIAQIYGVEESNGVRALVMELVEGPTLADRIGHGPIPLDEALPIARQIAEALEAAHEQGIIHRDLKPANIKVRADGTVKVLDFGLAKAFGSTTAGSVDVTKSPTLSMEATQAGVILGTAAYMAPEQARGKVADKRADIWAFGCVLYEILTGKRVFEGEDVSDTLAAVLRGEPDWAALPPDVPPNVRAILARCLEKDRKARIPDISAVRFLIDQPSSLAPTSTIAPSRPLWRRAIPVVVGAVVVGVIAAAAAWNLKPSTSLPVVRFPILLPERQQLASRSQVLALSPDGSRVVYAGGDGQLYLRTMADMETRPIAGTNLNVMSPFFSPDGQWIGLFSFQDYTLRKIAVSGGAPVTICKTDPPVGVTWDGEWILFGTAKGILRVSANGGEPEVLFAAKPGEVFDDPQFLNDGKAVLFTIVTEPGTGGWDRAQIVVQSIGSPERKVILRGGSQGHYVPTGYLVYTLGGTLLATRFDIKALASRSGPVAIIEGVRRFTFGTNLSEANFAYSRGGALVYVPASNSASAVKESIGLATLDGRIQPLDLPPQPYLYPRISPDGKQLAFVIDDGNEAFISVYDLKAGGPPRRLTFGGQNRYPVWTPDSLRVTFQSDRGNERGIFWQLADGTGPLERLTKAETLDQLLPEAWSPDGKTLSLAVNSSGASNWDIVTLSPEGEHALRPFAAAPFIQEVQSAFSPDGKWLAYSSTTDSGRQYEVFVQPFPRTGAKYQISTEGGRAPLWSPDGKQLYYVSAPRNHLIAVDVRTQPAFRLGKPVPLPIAATNLASGNERNYDITPDGKQFVVITSGGSVSADANAVSIQPMQQINVVLNWFDELNARLPAR